MPSIKKKLIKIYLLKGYTGRQQRPRSRMASRSKNVKQTL